MPDFSIIIPSYNEAENIPKLLACFADFMSNENGELILVNNGSTDATAIMEEEMKKQYPFLRWVHIEKNLGYGHGIYTGLTYAKGLYLGYTHADMQTDPKDIYRAIQVIKNIKNPDNIFVKGVRKRRNYVSLLFSKGLELIASLILRKKLYEINAQPVIFSANLFKDLDNAPLHWGFDLYVYYKARCLNYQLKRIDVLFPKRKHGYSKWQTGFMPRLGFSYKMLKYCFELYTHEKIRPQNKQH